MTLHILSCGALQGNALQNCLNSSVAGDIVVLIGDGVYNALSPPAHLLCFALEDDITKRSLNESIDKTVTLIDYPEFVELVSQHTPVCSWF